MPDYKEMYLKLFRATEAAISSLINAQRECEALYLDGDEPNITVFPRTSAADEPPHE